MVFKDRDSFGYTIKGFLNCFVFHLEALGTLFFVTLIGLLVAGGVTMRAQNVGNPSGDSIWRQQGNVIHNRDLQKDVGVGTQQPTERLDVAGRIRIRDLAGDSIRVVVADQQGRLDTRTLNDLIEGPSIGNVPTGPAFGKCQIAGPNTKGSWIGKSNPMRVHTCPLGTRVGIGTKNPLTDLHISGVPDASGSYGNYANSSFIIGADGKQQLRIFIDRTNDVSTIESVHNGNTNNRDLVLNGAGGNVGIGTTDPPSGYKLAVCGKVKAKEVEIEMSNWCDEVFGNKYPLPSLQNRQKWIDSTHHMPYFPPEDKVEGKGAPVGRFMNGLARNTEEQYRYLFRQQKQNQQQDQKLQQLEQENQQLKKQVKSLQKTVKKLQDKVSN